jgi:hypothetical protein
VIRVGPRLGTAIAKITGCYAYQLSEIVMKKIIAVLAVVLVSSAAHATGLMAP